ncbi:MAG: hydantoinase/oxoprolinase family protein, partial [Halobacteriota archaeon]
DAVATRARRRCSRPSDATIDLAVDLRYVGQSYDLTIPVDAPDPATLTRRFHERHERLRGYRLDEPVESVAVRATATVAIAGRRGGTRDAGDGPAGHRTVRVPGHEATAFTRYPGTPAPGTPLAVPCVIERPQSTIVVPPGWSGAVAGDGTVVIDRGTTS